MMKRTVKILSGLLAVLAVALCVVILLAVIGWPVSEPRMQELLQKMRRLPAVLLTIAAAAAIGAVGVFALYGLFTEHIMRRTSATIDRNALGETSISFGALERLANTAALKHAEVRTSKTKVTAIGDSIRIAIRVVASPTVSLLELTHALQNETASYIRDVCGVSIGKIDVTVDQTEESDAHSRI